MEKKKERLFTHEKKKADNENTEVFDKDSDYTELIPQPNPPGYQYINLICGYKSRTIGINWP